MVIPVEIATNDVKEEIEIHPVIAKTKISDCLM